jgi:hypothetical protein
MASQWPSPRHDLDFRSVGIKLGGHTIAKHIGKTEAELRARLVAQKWVPTASSFKSLDVAERVIYQALRSNRSAIEAWAKTAAPGAKTPFFYWAGEVVGHGVVRATGIFEKMTRVRVVLKMEAYKGKLYYILTAFPEL